MNAEPRNMPAVGLNWAKGVVVQIEKVETVSRHEAGVIGSLFQYPDHLPDCGGLAPEHFAVAEYGRAYKAMLGMDGRPFTPRSIADKSGVSAALLLQTVVTRPPLMNLVDYAMEIRNDWNGRRVLARAEKFASDGSSSDPMAAVAMYREAADEAERIARTSPEIDGEGLSNALLDHFSSMSSGASRAVPTGIESLTAQIGGWRPGELVVVAARPGMGKTVFAVSCARMIAQEAHYSVGFFSLEIGLPQTAARFTADFLRARGHAVPYSDIIRDDVHPRSRGVVEDASWDLRNLALFMQCDAGITIAALEARIERWKENALRRERPLGVVFIDYLKFLKATDRYKGNRVLEIGEITGGLKEIAKRQGVCIVLLTQLNRAVESRDDKRPTLADLRDSGEIEQDADIVLMLYREAYYLRNAKNGDEIIRRDETLNDLDVLVEKNRAGDCGTVHLWCDVATSSVRDRGQK